MKVKNLLPNLLTLGNLLCGTIAAIFAVKGDFYATALLVGIGIGFDFFDGFVARLLKAEGELGKQLDSLADMVTSGVVPGIVMMQLLVNALDADAVGYFGLDKSGPSGSNFPYLGLMLTAFACYRLAKFNIDARQSESFIGLPTPAMSLFVISLPLIVEYTNQTYFIELIQNRTFLILATLLLSVLMVSELRLFSLKFKNFSIQDNLMKYLFLAVSIALLVWLKIVAVPLIIILYVLLSIFENIVVTKK